MVEFRHYAVSGYGSKQVATALVLVGQVQAGVFHLRAVGRSTSVGWEDKLFWHSRWAHEKSWLEALDGYRRSGHIPAKLAKQLFLGRQLDQFSGLVVALVHVPLSEGRLGKLFLRVVIFTLMFGMLGWVSWETFETELWALAAIPAIGCYLVSRWFWVLLKIEYRFLFKAYAQFRTMYQTMHETTPRIVALSTQESKLFEENLAVRKHTADLLTAGYRLIGDLQQTPGANGGVNRVFQAPDEVSYLGLFFLSGPPSAETDGHAFWPANVTFFAHTFFTDGGWAVSMSGRSHGFRKKRTGSECSIRIFPDATDPLKFAVMHAAAAERFAMSTSRQACRNLPFEEYIRRQQAITDEAMAIFQEYPYTWSDHIHWYLQRIRKEYHDHLTPPDDAG